MGRRWRLAAGAVAVMVALGMVSACGSAEPPLPKPVAPLRILLVNDDGWAAPGIGVLRDALRRAGHQVIQVSPKTDRSSSGTATTTTGLVDFARPTRDRDIYTVSGTAADATLVGLSTVMGNAWPDMVISGINPEPTLGVGAMYSGTVGAALTAAGFKFPSIAVSTAVADPRRPQPAEFDRTADFVVRLVAAIERQRPRSGPMAPERTVLNVNYPGGASPARGVEVVQTSDTSLDTVVFRRGPRPGTLVPVPARQAPIVSDTDVVAFRTGNVVLTDLSVDLDRSAPPARLAAKLVSSISP